MTRNTATGTRHQVQTGANPYWMNGNGQYVPSNDPNDAPNPNHPPWDDAEIED